VIGLSINFENQISVVNHKFLMDLEWINNLKNRIEQQPDDITHSEALHLSFPAV